MIFVQKIVHFAMCKLIVVETYQEVYNVLMNVLIRKCVSMYIHFRRVLKMKIDINKALERVVEDDFEKHLKEYNKEAITTFIYVLHFTFGFGNKRLKQACDAITEMQESYKKRYELQYEDTQWLCERALREDGIDIDSFLKEEES